ncbi:MAG: ATP-binding protein [Pseudomonadota bacterium]
MIQVFGEFKKESVKSREFLMLGFSPGSAPLQQRWRNNGLSADFLADYLTTFFPTDDYEPGTREAKLKGAVSYIANELLENAMKFNYDTCDYQITLKFKLYSDHLVLRVTNHIQKKIMSRFQRFIHELLNSEPRELYIRQIKRSKEDESISGLGLLTMINDYDAKLGWQFETVEPNPEVIVVTTMAQLPI